MIFTLKTVFLHPAIKNLLLISSIILIYYYFRKGYSKQHA